MSQQVYSAHPELAAEQLQRAKLEVCSRQHSAALTTTTAAATAAATTSQSGSRRHVKATPQKYTKGRSCAAYTAAASVTLSTAAGSSAVGAAAAAPCTRKTLPVRTNYAAVDDDDDIECDDVDDVNFGKAQHSNVDDADDDDKTKDCVSHTQQQQQQQQVTATNNASATVSSAGGDINNACSIDETDHVQQRFKRHTTAYSRQTQQQLHDDGGGGAAAAAGGSISDLSSIISSPSASTVSSPLSTPTRLAPLQLQHSHQHCCQKGAAAMTTESRARQHPHQHTTHQHHHHHHHHHHQQQQQHQQHYQAASTACGGSGAAQAATSAMVNSGCKNKKLDPRYNPSPYRQLLPIALCLLSFATVFATLIVYMDTTEIRHQQFRLNMSRDYELTSVKQDDPTLIAFLRQMHMHKYPMLMGKATAADAKSSLGGTTSTAGSFGLDTHFGNSNSSSTAGGSSRIELASVMAHYVADLVGGRLNGAVIQSLTGPLANLITAPLLSEQLNWMGVLVEPEPRWFFSLRKQNAQRAHMQVVHACVSPNSYPKEITIHNDDVRINSLHDEETTWFNSRVKCFPLYTIMLACGRTEYELLSLGVQGHELDILQTLPFDKIKIGIISIHLLEDQEDVRDYVQSITKFLVGKSYKLHRKFGRNYFYQRLNAASRTRKKDILLLKTP